MPIPLKVGDIVRSSLGTAWGRGKVVAVDAGKVFIAFENVGGAVAKRLVPGGLEVLPGESVPLLDFLPPFNKKGSDYVLDSARHTLDELVSHFITCFPARFADPGYIGGGDLKGTGERAYKMAAHDKFVEFFGEGQAGQLIANKDGERIGLGIRAVLKMQNLLAKQELIAFQDALEDRTAAVAYLAALFEYLRATPTKLSFEKYASAVGALPKTGQLRVVTWPIATLLPFLSLEWGHMFLKPEVTKKAAAVMGVDLHYDSDLNWTTYERLLRLTGILGDALAPLGARDTVDIQSFIWVSFEYP